MPIRDIIAAALSRPAGRVVDGPVRDIVNEILADHGYASPAELAALKVDADSMRGRLSGVDARIAELESAAAALQDSVAALREELSRRPAESPAVRPSLAPAVAAPPAEPLEERQAWAERSVEQGSCKVLGCSERTHRSGFCVSHAGDWRAGRLAGWSAWRASRCWWTPPSPGGPMPSMGGWSRSTVGGFRRSATEPAVTRGPVGGQVQGRWVTSARLYNHGASS